MPQMELVPYNNSSNVDVMNAIRGITTSDYQNRVPAATKADIDNAIESMWNYSPARNQFVDALVNLIGGQILKYNTWTNPLAKFKRGMLNYGESLEEVAIGLLKAKHYNPDAEYLERAIFGRETNEVQSRWHKVDRQDMYKLSVNRNLLRRAFDSENGLSEFITGLMSQITTSDNWDEFLITTSLFRKYYEEDGFFKISVPDLAKSDAGSNEAKYFLRTIREYTDTLPFLSRKYNAAKMPIAAQPGELELFMTPRGKAVVDVDGLAAAFNIDKANVSSRITVIPDDKFNIPGLQAVLTTKEFFIIADQFMDMEQMNNPAGVYNNFFWHHHELISASPFVPALLLTSQEQTTLTILDYRIDGLSDVTLTDMITKAVVGTGNQTVTRGNAYLVAATAVTDPVNGPNNGVTVQLIGAQSGRTRLSQEGVLLVGSDESATTLTVRVFATADRTFSKDVTYTVTGDLLQGSVGQNIDSSPSAIQNRTAPKLNRTSATTGDKLTVNNGVWDLEGVTYSYTWTANGTAIASQTDNEYTVQASDVGKTIKATVTAARTGYTSSAAIPTSNAATIS